MFRCFKRSKLRLSKGDLFGLEAALAEAIVRFGEPGRGAPARDELVEALMRDLEEHGLFDEDSDLECGRETARAFVVEQADTIHEFLESSEPEDLALEILGDRLIDDARELGLSSEALRGLVADDRTEPTAGRANEARAEGARG